MTRLSRLSQAQGVRDLSRVLGGARVVPLGDSTVAANSTNASNGPNAANQPTWGSRDFFAWAQMLSGGRFQYVYNAGIAGDDVADVLRRFDRDVTPFRPTAVPLIIGINNAVHFDSLAKYAAGVEAVVQKIRSIGAKPWLFTVAPNVGSGARVSIELYNTYLRGLAAAEAIPLIDLHDAMVDITNGSYAAAMTIDGTHQSELGAKTVGQLIATALASGLPAWTPPFPSYDTADQRNLLLNGLFRNSSGGLGTSWLNTAGTPSIVADSAILGNWQRLTDATVTTANVRQNIGSGFKAGDLMECTGRITSVKGTSTATWSLLINLSGSGLACYVANAFTEDVTNGAFYQRFVVPAGMTSFNLQLVRACTVVGTGYSQIAQVAFRNLTALGIAA